MSAVDGVKKRSRLPMSEEHRRQMSERATAQHAKRRGFEIPPERKAEARKVMCDWHNQFRHTRKKGEGHHMPPELLRAALGLCFVLAMALPALGHSWSKHETARVQADGSWLQGTENPKTGDSCCGTNDCVPLDYGDVEITRSGYLIKQTGEFIPEDEAGPARDGRFWVCRTQECEGAGAPFGGYMQCKPVNKFDKHLEIRCFFHGAPGA